MSRLFWVIGVAAALCCAGPLLAADTEQAGIVMAARLGMCDRGPGGPILARTGSLYPHAGVAGPVGIARQVGRGRRFYSGRQPCRAPGLKPYDVLLKADGKALENPAGLVKAIQQAKENKLPLELIRAGKHMTITATPAKRPAEATLGETMPKLEGADVQAMKKLEEWLGSCRPKGARGRCSFAFSNRA